MNSLKKKSFFVNSAQKEYFCFTGRHLSSILSAFPSIITSRSSSKNSRIFPLSSQLFFQIAEGQIRTTQKLWETKRRSSFFFDLLSSTCPVTFGSWHAMHKSYIFFFIRMVDSVRFSGFVRAFKKEREKRRKPTYLKLEDN